MNERCTSFNQTHKVYKGDSYCLSRFRLSHEIISMVKLVKMV